MSTYRLLLATTALSTLATAPLGAAEVTPGGNLDIELSGFARFLATGGDWESTQLVDGLSKELDFVNDTEVHVTATGRDEASGLEYGGTIEFEADTNRLDNSDETWLFLRGGFGEVRLGDDDGIADFGGMAVNAAGIAAGTGGLDGTKVDTYVTKVFEPLGTSDATKIAYYTPSFSGFSAGASYTPQLDGIDSGANNGDALASTEVEAQNVLEGALVYEGELGGGETVLGLSGLVGDLKDADEDVFGTGNNYWALQAGAQIELFGLKFAGSYLTEEVGSFEQQGITAGVGYEYGALSFSVNYGLTLDTENADFDNPYILIFSTSYTLAPGLTLDSDIRYVDNDTQGALAEEFEDDSGVAGVVQVGLSF